MEKVEGIILKTRDYGETHKIISLFTKEKGKIGVIARGAKKPRSRMAALTQPFVYGTFLIQPSKNLGTLYQGEVIDSMRKIKEDIVKTAYAAYLAELTDKVLENHVPDSFLWEQFLHTLERMETEEHPEIISMIYELKIFQKGGFAPELRHCVSCGREDNITHFSVVEGGFLCASCHQLDSSATFLNERLFNILRTIRFSKVENIGKVSMKEDNKIKLRILLNDYYDRYGGFYLKSRKFLQHLDMFQIKNEDE
ncbi:DNA repair protein RecO (recombination protein O) [Salirhabdus euzebyi]|uniref:DNA repair protein RecO n=1 Tax=Salirhabdus euzebyi TaxID=394506 RepID=A0A841Q7L5_9BACI|nr:DNA repair protein RecO [Salirhabdus euzebyi]MBB6454307.1 DNA repair protein RecO (recombination protein O) [Salirhabdus euzebyi]